MSLTTLGTGPFRIIEVMDPEYSSLGGAPLPEAANPRGYKDHEGRCACCGSKLSWRVLVHDQANDRHLILGMTCAANAEQGIDPHLLATMKARAERARVERLLNHKEFVDWARQQPHPKGWRGKTMFDDLTYWLRRQSPKMSVYNNALKAFRSGTDNTSLVKDELEAFLADKEATLRTLPHPSAKNHPNSSLYEYGTWVLANRTTAIQLNDALNLIKGKVEASSQLNRLNEIKATRDRLVAEYRAERTAHLTEAIEEAKAEGNTKLVERLVEYLCNVHGSEPRLVKQCYSVAYNIAAGTRQAPRDVFYSVVGYQNNWEENRADYAEMLSTFGVANIDDVLSLMDDTAKRMAK
jgi:hypothetical protein